MCIRVFSVNARGQINSGRGSAGEQTMLSYVYVKKLFRTNWAKASRLWTTLYLHHHHLLLFFSSRYTPSYTRSATWVIRLYHKNMISNSCTLTLAISILSPSIPSSQFMFFICIIPVIWIVIFIHNTCEPSQHVLFHFLP